MQESLANTKNRSVYILLLLLAIFVNFCAIDSPFFTDDPGLYGSIAKQLIYHHNFFELYSYGKDWLDKPHLPFWFIALSFKLFGIHSWTYRLPAMLSFLLGLLYTYLLTRKYYNWQTAIMAVLIVSTSLHVVMSNTDVRAEPYLMVFITGAIYHIACMERRFKGWHFFMAALLTAFAIMTKGIFVIVPIYGALAGQLLIKGKFRSIFQLRWIALFLLTIIFITPELYALYIQFDSHPEKTVFQRQHVSGIKWFLWDSQFGRFSNQGPINRKSGSVLFFAHTLLWAFAPWCLLFYYAVIKKVKNIITGIKLPEYYTLTGGLLLLLLFSVSGFQLPFYTNIIFPLFAVITADVCQQRLISKAQENFRLVAQWLYIVLFIIVIGVLHYFLKPGVNIYLIIGVVVYVLLFVWIIKTQQINAVRVFMISCLTMLLVGWYVNTTFYPVITANKAQLEAAGDMNELFGKGYQPYSLKDQDNIFQFYCNKPVGIVQLDKFASADVGDKSLFYADQESVDYLNQHQVRFIVVNTFWDYPQENILPAFVNAATRKSTLQKAYLIRRP